MRGTGAHRLTGARDRRARLKFGGGSSLERLSLATPLWDNAGTPWRFFQLNIFEDSVVKPRLARRWLAALVVA